MYIALSIITTYHKNYHMGIIRQCLDVPQRSVAKCCYDEFHKMKNIERLLYIEQYIEHSIGGNL